MEILEDHESIPLTLNNNGTPLVVKDGMFEGLRERMRSELESISEQMTLAGMGALGSKWKDKTVRNDRHVFISPKFCKENGLEAMTEFVKAMIKLVVNLREGHGLSSLLGSKADVDYSFQYAEYDGNGSRYSRHLDTPIRPAAQVRRLTLIFYLNEQPQGGNLRVFLPTPSKAPHAKERHIDIAPLDGRLVIFRADQLEHEVLPSWSRRRAVTLWVSSKHPLCEHTSRILPRREREPHEQQQEEETGAGAGAKEEDTLSFPSSSDVAPEVTQSVALPDVGLGPVDGTIFCTIACYRDPECAPTVMSLYAAAYAPKQLVCAIVWQGEEEEVSGFYAEVRRSARVREAILSGRLRLLRMDAALATGPCLARRVAQSMWQGEDFAMQIDSHTRFRPGWDRYLKHMVLLCEKRGADGWERENEALRLGTSASMDNDCASTSVNLGGSGFSSSSSSSSPSPPRQVRNAKPVITAYPGGYELPCAARVDSLGAVSFNLPANNYGTLLVPTHFNDLDGMLRQKASTIDVEAVRSHRLRRTNTMQAQADGGNDEEAMWIAHGPLPSCLWAAGFSFARASVLLAVPYDPCTPRLFFGEEQAMAARMFTHGFDFWAPQEAVAFHLWSRNYRRTFQEQRPIGVDVEAQQRSSRARVRALLTSDPDVFAMEHQGALGLGRERSLHAWETRLGVSFKDKTLHTRHASSIFAFTTAKSESDEATQVSKTPGTVVQNLVASFLGEK